MQAAESGSESDSDSGSEEEWDRCVTFVSEMLEEKVEGKAVSATEPPAKKRRAKYISRVVLRPPSECTWAHFIADNRKALEEDEFSPAGVLFRQRFRVPYSMFCLVLGYAEVWFPQADVNAAGIPACGTYLKVLGVLRVLGRAYCFDSVGECTNTHKEIHRVFFHKFVQRFALELETLWIRMPNRELAVCLAFNAARGHPGQFCQTDGFQMTEILPKSQQHKSKGKVRVCLPRCSPHVINFRCLSIRILITLTLGLM